MPDFLSFITLDLVIAIVRAVLWLALAFLTWLWLRGELTPSRFLTIFESENVLSIRLILAGAWSIFCMCMLAAGRLKVDEVVKLNTITEILLFYGTVKVLGSRIARRPPEPPASITAKKAEVKVAGDANFQQQEAN